MSQALSAHLRPSGHALALVLFLCSSLPSSSVADAGLHDLALELDQPPVRLPGGPWLRLASLDDERIAAFRLRVRTPRARPFVHVTLSAIDTVTGLVRDRLSLHNLEPDTTGQVSSPWISLEPSAWRNPDPGRTSLRAFPGDRVVAQVRQGGGPAQVLEARVAPPSPFDELRRVPLSVKVVASTALSAALRHAVADSLARQLAWTNEVLAQCGLRADLSDPGSLSIEPPPHGTLLSLGDPDGLVPERLAARLVVDGRALGPWTTTTDRSPVSAARALAFRLASAGLSPRLIVNPRAHASAFPIADIRCLTATGAPATIAALGDTQGAALRLTEVDLRDGLACYEPSQSETGAPEQRALLHGLWPTAVPDIARVAVVERLSCSHQLGQSFDAPRGGPLYGAIIVERRGLERGRETFTLAHELGHVLLGSSAHPADRFEETRDRLMNATSSSIFEGPRRVTRAECERMRRSPLTRGDQR